ncbi:stage II sporulation protein P [Niallia sp. JL1B1071]|uniref:stage II sporulation protein P n=1 Tax=Niallia tiangongensis TaxID=3237105 RepID=UPI0037DCF186
MQNEKDLFDMIKDAYPQHPSNDFILSTENSLRQKARKVNRKWMIKKVSAISAGFSLFSFAISWLFFFNGTESITGAFHSVENQSSLAIEEKDPLVYIYHTHNSESFMPELGVTNPNEAVSDSENVTLVGKELSKKLIEKNINAIHDDTDITGILLERNLSFTDSYSISREKLQATLKEYKNIKMIFDIHRGSEKRTDTTKNIDGKDYARILFVVSMTSDNYEENKDFAFQLNEKLQQLYPGLSRGVLEKGVNPQNTYNQDLHNDSVLLEIGGAENSVEEVYRTTDAFAEVIKEIIEEKKNNSSWMGLFTAPS